jgi:hypothetical protein
MRAGIVAAVCLVVLALAGGTASAAEPPANDDFAGAQALSGPLPLAATGTTVGATRELGEPTAVGATPSGHSVWFRWEAQATGYVSVDTCGSEERTTLAVYTGSALGALAEVASSFYLAPHYCRDSLGEGSGVTFTAHAGTVYSIAVDGDGRTNEYLPAQSGEAPIDLRLTEPAPPANDDFADAVAIEHTALDGIAPIADTFGATRESGEPDHRGEAGGASVWFTWTAPRSGGTSFAACNSEAAKAVAAVYTGDAVGALTPVPEIEAGVPCAYTFFATAGTTYRLAVDGRYSAALGGAEMFENEVSIAYVPGNDDFADAAPLGDAIAATNGDLDGPRNIGATKEPGEPDHAGDAGGASVWYSFTASAAGSMQLSPCDATFPVAIAVYTGPSVDALTPVASARVPAGEPCLHNMHGPGDVRLDIEPGTTYHVAVDGVGGAEGHAELEWWGSRERLSALFPPPSSPTGTAPATTRRARAAKPAVKIAGRRIDQRLRSAAFALRATQPGARLRCELDRRRFVGCGTKVAYGHLTAGRHVFRVLAVGADGSAGTPVKAGFAIRRSG